MDIKINDRMIGLNHPTYFIADIAANHDGDLDRAKLLIRLAARSRSGPRLNSRISMRRKSFPITVSLT